ncbi:MAG TPA: diphosphate--fructose-6-phosphate 1-phosphotransferase [Candidatus Methylomirabilis sp.]|nr:diphosphate--fructose-6-phosphate 1-phosphotransferase [Candidatus Methylomirabilis sp.]
MKTLAILVGGGPAPGINAVIAAATIEARNRGLRVLGCHDGYQWLMKGDSGHVEELEIARLSRIHFDGGSVLRMSRANPAKSADALRNVVESLNHLDVSYLVTIGGDDTGSGAAAVARASQGQLAVAHVPKTIDNDLPLPAGIPTFGFTTAVDVGKDLVRNLLKDAATTDKWFFVTVMGRHAGHLALGIGSAAGATLTVIGEEFAQGPVSLDDIARILEGAIIKRVAGSRQHGVALVAEGLIERLDPKTLGPAERDPYGNVRLEELELSRLLKERVMASLQARGVPCRIVAQQLGYELRCAPPDGFDIHYCRGLGYWATRFLVEGGREAIVTVQGDRFVPMPFSDLIDARTGRFRVRYVDVSSEAYRMLAAYMIRLTRADLENPEQVRALARAGALDEAAFIDRFAGLVRAG